MCYQILVGVVVVACTSGLIRQYRLVRLLNHLCAIHESLFIVSTSFILVGDDF